MLFEGGISPRGVDSGPLWVPRAMNSAVTTFGPGVSYAISISQSGAAVVQSSQCFL